jgi:drug/metabolite transporter (DMT)-like permease
MIGYGRWQGVRMSGRQAGGLAVALAGLVYLLLPGLSAPPLEGSVLMIAAGIAWGVYSLRAKGSGDPLRVTAGNFIRAVVPAVALGAALLPGASIDGRGVAYAIASGALASGVGYALWYSALVGLNVTRAATVQLSVPLIAALGGVLFLDEHVTLRLIVASVAILGGIAWVVTERRPA